MGRFVNVTIATTDLRKAPWRRLLTISEFTELTQARKRPFQLHSVSRANRKPLFFPVTYSERIEIPESTICENVFEVPIENAIVAGGTNLIACDDMIICHDLYDWARDWTSEELHSRARIDLKRKRIKMWGFKNPAIELEAAAAFVDSCATNYAHWTTEVLPRLALFCRDSNFTDIPLLVDADLHPNIVESIRWIAGENRQVVSLRRCEAALVRKLHWISPVGYVPFQPRHNQITGYNHGIFNPSAFAVLREKLKMSEDASEMKEKKIFLKRSGSYRNLLNSHELEAELTKQGFETVQPEKLSFQEQVRLFQKASIIVGPIGASFANIVFCQPTTKVIILTTFNKDMLYGYWSQIAGMSSGTGVRYALGKGNGKSVHSDFWVDLAVLNASIQQ